MAVDTAEVNLTKADFTTRPYVLRWLHLEGVFIQPFRGGIPVIEFVTFLLAAQGRAMVNFLPQGLLAE